LAVEKVVMWDMRWADEKVVTSVAMTAVQTVELLAASMAV
jgi:hypothetical protein